MITGTTSMAELGVELAQIHGNLSAGFDEDGLFVAFVSTEAGPGFGRKDTLAAAVDEALTEAKQQIARSIASGGRP